MLFADMRVIESQIARIVQLIDVIHTKKYPHDH